MCWTWVPCAVLVAGLMLGCGSDAATEDCADCPNLELQPACEEAASDCDQVSGSDRQTCLDEARALCD